MPRTADIQTAFNEALQLNPKGNRYLSTDSFMTKIREMNLHFSRDEANAWIEHHQPDFANKTIEGSDNRYWILRNMGKVF
ncbi:hypothetical protein M8R60_09220 [Enterobacter hormaechei]|uniref:hypothetical protein n=1 Tax=Enterobacter hormaechei TaxID=158836 RepID=UPI0005ECCB18|nr:hypothetical protein [Enterobacter hormaechei]KJM81425.1 hypothetical protein SS12_12130 [Enterobacter hormaechei subsp. hoffmannii]MCM7401883.1 hypothetical protein [Enterobacter hormaechei]MCU2459671.1 hypothetical protein [Enterobacter hormaechei subsp. hoffmannii]MCU3423908.1 hypothetical protein [Enterobacter hormaechei subsp. hoffmannii]MCU3778546.1 hypothetical protein [Enterobacter hormaechei subsp. hoffmannii]